MNDLDISELIEIVKNIASSLPEDTHFASYELGRLREKLQCYYEIELLCQDDYEDEDEE